MSRTCRAVVADGHGSFTLETVTVNEPRADEVLVELRASGICHTDHASLRWVRPLVMGHEGAGTVRAVGDSIRHVQPGDRVLLNWAIPCRSCPQCLRGNHSLCEWSKPAHVLAPSAGHAHPEGTQWRGQPIDRSFNLGTLSEFTLVKGPAVTRLPDDVPFASACIVGCGVMTGFGSAVNSARIAPGSTVAVLGVGGVGLNAIQGARIAGASRIFALARKRERLETARRFGATDLVVVGPDDPECRAAVECVHRLNNGRGVDFAFEATAVPALAFLPLLLVRDGGMALQLSGINDPVTVDPRWFMWDKSYIAPLYGRCTPDLDFPRIFDLYRRKQLLLDELVTRTYALDDVGAALDDMMSGRNSKGVILFAS